MLIHVVAVAAMTSLAGFQATVQFDGVYAGDCAVTVVLPGARVGDVVQVLLDLGRLRDQSVTDSAQMKIEVPTESPLQSGQKLRLLINGTEIGAAAASVMDSTARPAGQKPAGKCEGAAAQVAEGDSLRATAYVGWAYDQFAPDSIGGYPPNTTTARHNRALFGVDFDYRMFGTDATAMQFWVTGETMHGVRSADVDCSAETNKPAICNPTSGQAYARAVLENASSLEAYVAPRLEFLQLQKGASTPTQLYATARFGFIALDDAPRVYKNHHVGVGLMASDGPFKNSLLEFGWGMNEMLSGRRWKRLKVDGYLTFSLDGVPVIRDRGRLFMQMFIDNDLAGNTADSIQTFFGFELDIRRFFGG
jgi:hypothetical protein